MNANPNPAPHRISATEEAISWFEKLTTKHGKLMFHQSGGCCDGSAPMCFPDGEFRVGANDVLLGHVGDDISVWIGADQFEYWRHTQITIDVVPGRGAGMSLEAPEGVRFIVRSRIFTDEEAELLMKVSEPIRGG